MNGKRKFASISSHNKLIEDSQEKPPRKQTRLKRILNGAAIAGGVCIMLILVLVIVVETWPVIGAVGSDLLRNHIGDKAVADLEMAFYQVQDDLQKLKYKLGQETPVAPWNTQKTSQQFRTPAVVSTKTAPPKNHTAIQPTPSAAEATSPAPTLVPSASIWPPVDVAPLGAASGEGVWSAYIQDAQGNNVAYRTFLQPDPTRPYTLVAMVAFDLSRTRLHFVLGTIEPAGGSGPPRSGAIPATDRAANILLAAFNGGFKGHNGQFGAMADGVIALPPRDGLGTLVIYNNGRVGLGEWGSGLFMTPDVVAYRQNGPLVIQQGQINSRIFNNSPQDWGYTVNDVSPTVRSGIGLSADGRTLFYFCGPSLSMQALAKTMQAAGAWNAIQLDINNYWTLFVKIQISGSKVIPEPLLPTLMVANLDRYLWNFSRDYFYITSSTR
jgi:hypothetical protein